LIETRSRARNLPESKRKVSRGEGRGKNAPGEGRGRLRKEHWEQKECRLLAGETSNWKLWVVPLCRAGSERQGLGMIAEKGTARRTKKKSALRKPRKQA